MGLVWLCITKLRCYTACLSPFLNSISACIRRQQPSSQRLLLCLSSSQESPGHRRCAEELVLWATAVATADGVPSTKQVQEAVIGACSSVSHPWPELPALLEAALPHPPIERVRSPVCADFHLVNGIMTSLLGVLVSVQTFASFIKAGRSRMNMQSLGSPATCCLPPFAFGPADDHFLSSAKKLASGFSCHDRKQLGQASH